MPKDFSQAKIYKIVSPSTNLCYVGATTKEYLSQRMAWHTRDYRCWCENKEKYKHTYTKCFDVMKFGDARIELIECYPCKNIDELNARERYWIDNTPNTTNRIHPSRTRQEYYKECLTQIKEYKEKNTGKIVEYNKQYMKTYYKQNIDKWNKYNEKYTCECGKTLTLHHKSRHEKSKSHINRKENYTL